jgi:SAM-dependent methyltransferase
MLEIAESDIRRHGAGNALAACWRQWRAERSLARRGIRFRATEPAVLAAAYAAMSEAEFAAINARQDWANWRTIPRCLNGHVPDRPLCVLDLGCGTGSSTRVLAFYCPAGSRLIGLEMVQPLLEVARRRSYCRRSGATASVTFVCQAVTEPFRQSDGRLVSDLSVDLVNASGVVGHHLSTQTIRPLVAELQRVLAPDGTAFLDVGPTLPAKALASIMTGAGFCHLGRRRSWWGDPTGQVVFSRSSGPLPRGRGS